MFLTRILFRRPEQKKLRLHLINNYKNECNLCKKEMPEFMLECCHIKPRKDLIKKERYDYNNVFLLCRNCHKIFDEGYAGIDDGIIKYHQYILDYRDLNLDNNLTINNYEESKKFFDYHYKNIFNN